jgi:hypothetical protein
MEVSSRVGLIVLFGALAWSGYKSRFILKIVKVRRISIGLHDEEIKEVTLISNLRDAMAQLMLYSISLFLMPSGGMEMATIGSPEYTTLTHITDFTAGTTFGFGVLTIALHILKRMKMRNLEKTVRRDSREPRKRAKMRMRFKAKSRT